MSIAAWWPLSLNVGDRLTPWLFEKIKGELPCYVESSFDSRHLVIGGSVLNHANRNAVVWGSGLGTMTDGVNSEMQIRAVRGPISRARALSCGAKCPAVYGDPGVLVNRWFKSDAKREHMGIVPHYVDEFRVTEWVPKAQMPYKIVSPLQDVDAFLSELSTCRAVLSSSLHGIIFAHALGIPALWVKFSDSVGGDGTKFRDWYSSLLMNVDHALDMRAGLIEIPGDLFTCPPKPIIDHMAGELWKVKPI